MGSSRGQIATREPKRFENLQWFEVMGKSLVVNRRSGLLYDVSDTGLREALTGQSHTPREEVSCSEKGEMMCGTSTVSQEILDTLDQMNDAHVSEVTQWLERTVATEERRDVAFQPAGYTVFPTHSCNMRCSYCFAEDRYLHRPSTCAPRGGASTMTREIAEQAVEYMVKNAGTSFGVGFFGGEPMLSFDLVRYIVERTVARSAQENKKVNFAMTTNGTIMTEEHVKFLEKHNFKLIVSFDATRELQNTQRPLCHSRRSSYEVVLENLKTRFLPSKLRFTARATTPLKDLDYYTMAHAMLDAGITEFSIEPTLQTADDYDRDEYEKVVDSLHRWARSYVDLVGKRRIRFFYFMRTLERLRNLQFDVKPCRAGTNTVTISADGSLWPCHAWVGDLSVPGNWKLGTLTQGITNSELVDVLRSAHVGNREHCTRCWARLICSGFCMIPRMSDQRIEPGKPYFRPTKLECAFMRDVIKTGAWVYSELEQRYPEGATLAYDDGTNGRYR